MLMNGRRLRGDGSDEPGFRGDFECAEADGLRTSAGRGGRSGFDTDHVVLRSPMPQAVS
jgi:hypothetical protein